MPLLLALAACGGPSADDLIASAKTYLNQKDDKAAVIQLKNALQKKPESAEARFLLGKAYLESGDAQGAVVELAKAVSFNYPPTQVLPVLARALLATGQYKKLTDDYAGTDLPDPSAMADLKTSVASAYSSQGDKAKAGMALAAAVKAVPDYIPALILDARIKAARSDVDGASAVVEKVLAVAPSDPVAWQLKGDLVLSGKGDAAAARAAYEKSLALKPDFVGARSSLISLLLVLQDYPAAEAQIAELRKTGRAGVQVNYFEAHLAYLKKDNVKARDLLQQVLKVTPNNAKALQLAGAVALNSGSLIQAETYLRKALQLSPELPTAYMFLARTLLRSGQPDKALEALKPLLTAADPQGEAFSLAGEAYLQTGDLKLAEQSYARAAELDPKDSKSRTALAVFKLTEGNVDAAVSELQSISADGGNDTSADMALLSTYLRRNDLDGAMKAIDSIEKKAPDKPTAALLRGRIFLLKKDIPHARASFERALTIAPAYIPAAASLADLDLADQKPELARKRFEAVLAADPKNMRALLALAGIRARTGGSKEEVATQLASAITSNPTDIAPRLVLIDHYLSQNDGKRALQVAKEALTAFPDAVELLDAMGRAQLAAGETNQAVTSFKKMVSLRPNSPGAYVRLGNAYIADKNPPAAMESFQRALGVKADYLPAQQGLIALQTQAKQFDDAIATARTVERQRPANSVGYLLEGGIELSRDRPTAAEDIFRNGLKKAPRTDLATKLHSVLGLQKKDAAADAFAKTWLKGNPNDVAFLFYMGEISLGHGDFPAAENYFQQVVRLKQDDPIALNNLAWVYWKQKKAGATAYAQKANDLLPNTPSLMDTLALTLAADQKVDKAIELQKKALTIASDSPMLRLNLAKFYIQAGDKRAARTELESLAKLNDKFSGQQEVGQLLQGL
jgi:putative PEP-CTERM system TPR-repeat lipoprotein